MSPQRLATMAVFTAVLAAPLVGLQQAASEQPGGGGTGTTCPYAGYGKSTCTDTTSTKTETMPATTETMPHKTDTETTVTTPPKTTPKTTPTTTTTPTTPRTAIRALGARRRAGRDGRRAG
ncbi:MAG: hypothetical protein JWP53_2509 [Conexibacter sp.]|nr:hypothetical protein [Conexibacter sp.]